MSLDEYRRKRSFQKTPEPDGEVHDGENQWRFVIQKHAASSLHYDLRLEYDGVLKSWAVPKGPDPNLGVKRLAIQTEDHPLDYLLFEGIIPQGEYGGGTVIVWDTGLWAPLTDDGWETGNLKFSLDGEKIQGNWALIQTGKRRGNPKQWMLIKERDQSAREDGFDLVAEFPLSVLTGRSLEEVAADPDAVWTKVTTAKTNQRAAKRHLAKQRGTGKKTAGQTNRSPKVAAQQPSADISIRAVKKKKKAALPSIAIAPSLPTAIRKPPQGERWVHEIKYDGYRMIATTDKSLPANQRVKFTSRNGKDWTDKLPRLAKNLKQLKAKSAILDGEVVAMAADGTTDFQALQNTIGRGDDRTLQYFVFDLLHLDGYDLTRCTLADRKQLLAQLLKSQPIAAVEFSEHIQGDGQIVFQEACRLGAEGIVSKRIDRPYAHGRTDDWLKIKSLRSADFVIGGFSPPASSRIGFGALVVGAYGDEGLTYLGRVGTGFSSDTLAKLHGLLKERIIDESPFVNLDRHSAEKGTTWVEPELIAEVEFAAWTRDQVLRHPVYRGLRDDIHTDEVTVEAAHSLSIIGTSSGESSEPPTETSSQAAADPGAFPDIPDIRLTNPERVMYPTVGVSKIDIVAYYAQVAESMLPHVAGRPLALVRCPKGIDGQRFFQKKATKGMPNSIEEITVTNSEGESQTAVCVHDLEGLLYLVQFSTLEIHVWGSRVDKPTRPDRIVFDLDPDESIPFPRVVQTALRIREFLDTLKLTSFVKTTGGKGLHVVVPYRRTIDWSTCRTFTKGIAALLTRESPGRYTTSPSKSVRQGKIYIDVLRNGFGATAIAPFSTRAKTGATVAVPLDWEELSSLRAANTFHIRNIHRRFSNGMTDPWSTMADVKQSITKQMIRAIDL